MDPTETQTSNGPRSNPDPQTTQASPNSDQAQNNLNGVKLRKDGQPDKRCIKKTTTINTASNAVPNEAPNATNNNSKKRKAEQISCDQTNTETNSDLATNLKKVKSNSDTLNQEEEESKTIDFKLIEQKKAQLLNKISDFESKISKHHEQSAKIEKEAQIILKETEDLKTKFKTSKIVFPSFEDLEQIKSSPNDSPKSKNTSYHSATNIMPQNPPHEAEPQFNPEDTNSNYYTPRTYTSNSNFPLSDQDHCYFSPSHSNKPVCSTPGQTPSESQSHRRHYSLTSNNTNWSRHEYKTPQQSNNYNANNYSKPHPKNTYSNHSRRKSHTYNESKFHYSNNTNNYPSHQYTQNSQHQHSSPRPERESHAQRTIKILWKGHIITPTHSQLFTYEGMLDNIKRAIGYREPTPEERDQKDIIINWKGTTLRPTPDQLRRVKGNLNTLRALLNDEVTQPQMGGGRLFQERRF